MRKFICLSLIGPGLFSCPAYAQDYLSDTLIRDRHTVFLSSSIPPSEDYDSFIREIYNLGRYGIDPINLGACEQEGLQTLTEKASLTETRRAKVDKAIQNKSGEEIWQLLLQVAEGETDLVPKTGFEQTTDSWVMYPPTRNEEADSVISYLMLKASDEGHPAAMNEVGSSQLYCYNGVKQDLPAAFTALQRASQQGDEIAKLSLGKMYNSGLGTAINTEEGKRLEDEAFEALLKKLSQQRQLDNK